ncbi:MAG TPA: beta-ketoacyl synthase N-terminal-like domain-containing protein, partial [Candidatus Nanopelagicales bacterium]|nr:beta-ketoacyl synthase N-terminal-like domain-containing protein [Candidatus Nanopelagicales bacterium]
RCSKTLFFEHTTLEQVCASLRDTHRAALERAFAPAAAIAPIPRAAPGRAAPARLRESTRPGASAEPIAVIGLAGTYPDAPDLDHFWKNLEAGRDCVGEVPRSRWDVDAFFDHDRDAEGKTYTRWGAFLEDVQRFDHRLFQISPREARTMDPQERLFLQTAWAALENAGYPRRRFLDRSPDQRNAVAVFAGVTWGAYQLYAAEQWARGNRLTLDSSFWSIANRVSWFFNFHGPSMPVDTACSASLAAITLACDSLDRGEVEMALAGGVNLYLHPSKYLTISRQGFASSDGRCRGFGLGGDGYVPGEGVGAVLLKPLHAAERDGDFIHGVIRGWAINHGGHTSGYSVPNPHAQAEVVRAALRRAGVDARSITYLEAHGTGTALGDPIELAGLNAAYGRSDEPWCGLGTVKSNIGHLESAAGIAGLTKVLLQMRHRRLAPTLHVEQLNPNLDLKRSPFRVQQRGAPWMEVDGNPLRAGISSFGAGGANAHIIVERYEDVRAPAAAPRPQCLVLSARTPEQLRQSAARLQLHLATHDLPLSWTSFTLQTRRDPMSHRLALVASTRDEAIARLEAFLENRAGEWIWLGQIAGPPGLEPAALSTAAEWLREGRLAQAASHWVKGREIPWTEYHHAADRRCVPLPTYPFAGERLWAPDRFPAPAPVEPDRAATDPSPLAGGA